METLAAHHMHELEPMRNTIYDWYCSSIITAGAITDRSSADLIDDDDCRFVYLWFIDEQYSLRIQSAFLPLALISEAFLVRLPLSCRGSRCCRYDFRTKVLCDGCSTTRTK
mgnify:CR=1 FL=1